MLDRLLDFGKSLGPTRFFLVTAAFFGFLFLIITPPFQGADEVVHFYRAYQVSDGNLVSDYGGNGIVGGKLPIALGQVVARTNTPPIAFYPQLKYDIYSTKHTLAFKTTSQEKFYTFPASAMYAPTSYVGSSTGIMVSRLLHLPTLMALYAGRLGNLITWLVLAGAAIYYMPKRRWALTAIALLPMTIFQAATLNGDAATIGSLMLFLSLILNFKQKPGSLNYKQLAILLFLGIFMVLSKQIMFIFLPIILLLGKDKFKTKSHQYILTASLILIPLACFLGWSAMTAGFNGASAYSNHQNPSAQLRFITHNPFSFINVLWNTYFYTWGDTITRSFIGVFGWADAPLSELIVVIGYIGLAALLIATPGNGKPTWLSKPEKRLIVPIIFLYWAAVSTSLYLYYSPVGYKIIYGLQGRYFIPMAVLFVPLFQSKSVRLSSYLYKRIAIYLPLFLLICSTITLYVRYFVKNV